MKPCRTRKGTAIVEFALGSGLLLALFAGTFEIGYTLIQYNKLQTAVSQGARYASVIPYDSATETPSSAFLTAVQNMVLYGAPAPGTNPVVSGLTPSDVNVAVTFTNGVPSSIEVSLAAFPVYALFGSYTLTGKPRVSFPYHGVWAPV